MRVAMLTYSTRPRGGVVHALKLAERLSDLGVDVTLYSLARSDDPKGRLGYFRKVRVPFKIIQYRWSPELITRLNSMILAYTQGLPKDVDIYHAQDCVGGTALEQLRRKGTISAPVFRTIHHIDDFADHRLLTFEKKAMRYADHRFVVSQYWKRRLRREYGLDSIVSYNGIDLGDFQGLPKKKSKLPTVLFVGGLEPRKGLEYLLLAMECVVTTMPDARLVAVAKTGFRGADEWSWFTTLAERLGIKRNMDFRESVTESTLLRLYSESDVVVLPSKTEGWGLSLMEAMACSKPVIASRVGGVPELVKNGVNGLLVEAGDVTALSNAILKVLTEKNLARKLGRAGKSSVGRFSWDDTARIVLGAYRRAL